jgi:protein-S-isoprenylcysteine O-methyltransferase Ste14
MNHKAGGGNTWNSLAGKVIGRVVTLASVVVAASAILGLILHPLPIGSAWLLIIPYVAYEGSIAVFGLFQYNGKAFASNVKELIVPLIGTWLLTLAVLLLGGNVADSYVFLPVYAWLAWSSLLLGRNFSVLPEARVLVRSGPYSIIRHPLYLGYSAIWLVWAIGLGTPLAFALMAVGIGLLEWRARMEERKISSVWPEYREYMTKTWRLIPGFGRMAKEDNVSNV